MIPTTVVTGSLGAGKTTIIKNLVGQLDPNYKTLWLKNEYGDVNIDSDLANESNLQTKEILNGCLCCVLVGKLHEALEEIVKDFKLDRLIIETAGTAYPGPIVQQIQKVSELKLDGLITVVDALNFETFYDKSYLARQEARFVDLVIINKINLVEKPQLDFVEDEVYELYPGKTIIKTKDGNIPKGTLIGIDNESIKYPTDHSKAENGHHHSEDDIEVFTFEMDKEFNKDTLSKYVSSLNPQDFYRIKGIINTKEGYKLLNYVLGRMDWQDLTKYQGKSKITFMGKGISGLEPIIKKNLFS